MYNLKDYIEQKSGEYEREIRKVKAELQTMPPGHLIRRNISGKKRYFQAVNGKELGITRRPDLVQLLTRKKYLQEYLKRLEHNVYYLKKLKLQDLSLEQIKNSLSATYREEPLEMFFAENEVWEGGSSMNPKNRENLTISTSHGILVRSKSEQIIGNALEARGVPYSYETELHLGNRIFYPDFAAKRLTDGELCYWEHWGMMENPAYVRNMQEKIKIYREHGIVPWKNLICTYEEDTRDSRRIDRLVELMFC